MRVQIDEQLFVDLCRHHLLGVTDRECAARIRQGLEDKLEAILRRKLYTDSKTAATAAERERARQAYLDERGIPDAFRWSADDK